MGAGGERSQVECGASSKTDSLIQVLGSIANHHNTTLKVFSGLLDLALFSLVYRLNAVYTKFITVQYKAFSVIFLT